MNPYLRLGVVSVTAAVVSAALGYAVGFRQGWHLSLLANAAPRGSLALAHTQMLDSGRVEDVRLALDYDIDNGLLWWSELEKSPAYPVLNILTSQSIVPDYEQYLRRLAAHRATHSSPLLNERFLVSGSGSAIDGESVREMERGIAANRETMARMVARYGQ